jgi:opacity protein-like surface antigen
MGQNQFDKQIKDRLQFHESEVSPGLWENIEAKLQEEGKRRIAPFFLMAAIGTILIMISIGVYLLNNSDSPKSVKVSESVYPASPSAFNQNKYENTTPATNINNAVSGQNPIEIESDITKTPSASDILVVNSNTKYKKRANTGAIPSISDTQTDKNALITSGVSDITVATEPISTGYSAQATVGQLKSLLFSPLQSVSKSKGVLKGNKKIIPKDNCLNDFNHRGIGMSMDVYYGNDIPLRSMSARESVYTNLVNKRKETETPLYSYSLGARLGFRLSEKFNMYTGAHFSKINEKFEYTDPESSQTKIVETKLYIFDGAGNIKDSTFTFDTIYIPGTLVYKVKNQYSMIDIPFLVGFTLLQKDRLSLDINVGIMANLVFKKSGMALNNDLYSVRNFNDTQAHNFHNSLGISSYLGAQFAYGFYDRFSLFIEPNVRIYHRGLTSKDYPVSHKYTVTSFFTGVKYNF